MSSVLDRFVHRRLAAVAIGGATVWAVSFLIAATGLALRAIGQVMVGIELFFFSGLLGLLGIAVLGACALWLVGLWVRRAALSGHSKQ